MAALEFRLRSDATRLDKDGAPKILTHLLSDSLLWGLGFTQAIDSRWPTVALKIQRRLKEARASVVLGDVLFSPLAPLVEAAHLIAERSRADRDSLLDLDAFTRCIAQVADRAQASGATVHAPPLGTGLCNAPWPPIHEVLESLLVRQGVNVVVHCLGAHPPR